MDGPNVPVCLYQLKQYLYEHDYEQFHHAYSRRIR
jgi:hypothetical protein